MVSQENHRTSEVGAGVFVLGIPIHPVSPEKTLEVLDQAIEAGTKMRIVTLNPEMIMRAQTDQRLARAICGADLTVPDGVGVVWAMRRKGIKGQTRIAGVDLIESLLDQRRLQNKRGLRLFLLGGRPGVAAEAGERLRLRWPFVEIVGSRDGYFSVQENEEVLQEVNKAAPDLLLAGMGLPKQELWLAEYWERLRVKLAVGIGGGLNLWAGRIKRAPQLVRRMGLEWLFRTFHEPQRITRLKTLPSFVLEVFREVSSEK
jgi:N-acetylglucosaminyldiphosphoundecaprenol N-acetyl-beta-D-mannosaminyltransferase